MSSIYSMIIGLIGGLVSGLFGVGGGLVFVPLFVLLKKMDAHAAVGTSLAIIVPTAFIGALKHMRAGAIDWKALPWVLVFALIGSWIGAGLSLQMDVVMLRRAFAVFLLFLAFKMFFPN